MPRYSTLLAPLFGAVLSLAMVSPAAFASDTSNTSQQQNQSNVDQANPDHPDQADTNQTNPDQANPDQPDQDDQAVCGHDANGNPITWEEARTDCEEEASDPETISSTCRDKVNGEWDEYCINLGLDCVNEGGSKEECRQKVEDCKVDADAKQDAVNDCIADWNSDSGEVNSSEYVQRCVDERCQN